MVLCPRCGGLFTRQQPKGALADQDLYHPEDMFIFGCLCHYDLIGLERIVTNFEDRLNKNLSDRFPGKKMSDIQIELGKMDRHAPLRISLVKRIQTLRRAQDRLAVLRKEKGAEEEQEDRQQEMTEKSIAGEAMSVHDWIVGFTK